MLTRRKCFARALVLGAACLCVLAGSAPTLKVIHSDNFNNNSVNNNFWAVNTWGGLGISEANQRLEFHTKGPQNPLSYSGLRVRNWGINWKRDFNIRFDYRLNIPNVNGDKQLFVGTALAAHGSFPNTMTGVAVGMLRDHGGLWMGAISYSDGKPTGFNGVPITQTTGRIIVDWDRSEDVMTIRRGTQQVEVNGLWAWYGAQYGNDPMAIVQGTLSLEGNFNFNGNRVHMDNWRFEGFKRAFTR